MTWVYVGLGGNVAPVRRHLWRAERLLRRVPGARLAAFSSLYVSAPLGCPGRQGWYCNAAARLQTVLAPQQLHARLRGVEARVQRRRRRRNAPRCLDVDYLRHGAARCRHPRLVLPHPRLLGRAFVLRPLLDVYAVGRTGERAALRRALRGCRGQMVRRLRGG